MTHGIPTAILGATGTVGQRLVQMLDEHPSFEVVSLVASSRSAGQTYGDAVRWRLPGTPPRSAQDMVVTALGDPLPDGLRVAFSCLDSSVAKDTEVRYATEGVMVVSNASAHRMSERVPLVVPEVNADHLSLLEQQDFREGGGIVCNPNCSTIGLVLAIAPLHRAFGVEAVEVTMLQAASGAGYPGVPSMDLIDNVVPLIPGEEDKLAEEPAKILGSLTAGGVELVELNVSAQCFRVPVSDGHTASVSLRLGRNASEAELRSVWDAFAQEHRSQDGAPLAWACSDDRPQPRLDRDLAGGMGVTLGRLRPCSVLDWRFVALSHNTVRGAAGGTLRVAETLLERGLL